MKTKSDKANTTKKVSAPNSREIMYAVYNDDGLCVGVISKFKDTRTETHPWKAFVYADKSRRTEMIAPYFGDNAARDAENAVRHHARFAFDI